MNATELAKMLEGWPEDARPKWLPDTSPPGKGWTFPHLCLAVEFEGYANQDAPMECFIDLACMSGLRWLVKQPCPSTEIPGPFFVTVADESAKTDGTAWIVMLEWFQSESDTAKKSEWFSGPTLLHAIDAAIQSTKGIQ